MNTPVRALSWLGQSRLRRPCSVAGDCLGTLSPSVFELKDRPVHSTRVARASGWVSEYVTALATLVVFWALLCISLPQMTLLCASHAELLLTGTVLRGKQKEVAVNPDGMSLEAVESSGGRGVGRLITHVAVGCGCKC